MVDKVMNFFYKTIRIFNTIKYLQPIQLIYQIKNRIPAPDSFKKNQKTVPCVNIFPIYIPELDADKQYLSRFNIEEILSGKITLLGHTFTPFRGWYDNQASHLQNFNLHYFEFAIPLAIVYKETKENRYKECIKQLYENWKKNGINQDALHPYTISLRLCNLLVVGFLLKDTELIRSLYPQYRYLVKHQEKHLLGNHYFENLKTIVLCSLVFDDLDIYQVYISKFIKELSRQILADGVHYELSLMYHKIVLEGLIRVAYALKQLDKHEYHELRPFIQKMVSAVSSLEEGMGKTPSFNDSADDVAKNSIQLVEAITRLFDINPKQLSSFPHSGYYKLYDGNLAVLFDTGRIGPNFMPGHGHCDCLSFELSIAGNPLFVNSGTFQYQGEKRRYFRSTRAHNTVMINNHEQSEYWGEHRVARRISGNISNRTEYTVSGSFKNYLGELHHRIVCMEDYTFSVLDKTTGSGLIHSYLHVADGFKVLDNGTDVLVIMRDEMRVCQICPVNCMYAIHSSGDLTQYAPKFGIIHKTLCLEFLWNADKKEHGYTIYFEDNI
nr:alginate lyase family protein [uncultured Sphaerochaeta sp.]